MFIDDKNLETQLRNYSEANELPQKKSYGPSTQLVHFNEFPEDPYNASCLPIYQTSTYKQPSASEVGKYEYSRYTNPTRYHVERHLAKFIQAEHCFLVSCGMMSVDTILRLTKCGEEVITGNHIYGGTLNALTRLETHSGVKVHQVDTTNPDKIMEKLNNSTKLVFIESPSNPLLKISDIRAISSMVHNKCPNALVVVDNTLASPYLQKPLELGADLVIDSGTKYMGGHHDIMAGLIGVKSPELCKEIESIIHNNGSGLTAFDSFLLLRGLKTLALRMDRQMANAQKLAEMLESEGFKVHYPGLQSHPQHKLFKSMSRGAGGLLSFETGNSALSELITKNSQLFHISMSFGSVSSLMFMPFNAGVSAISDETVKELGLPRDLIRVSCGIEDIEDLLDDLQNAIKSARLKVNSNYQNGERKVYN